MDYEKKYKDALERAKEIKSKILLSHLSTESCKAVSEYIDTIIPELAESEDERIRKTLIEELSACETVGELKFRLPQPTRDEVLAWLEKQKEPKNTSASTMIPSCWAEEPSLQKEPKPWRVGANAYFTPEQKPAEWSDDIIQKAVKEVGLTQHQINWFKTNVFPPKQEWSEEDKTMLNNLIWAVHMKSISPLDEMDDRGKYERYEKFLTSLPERFGLKPEREWSEEDEKMVKEALYCVGYTFGSTHPLVAWLKSLRPQPHWKPSEEQMKALQCAIVFMEIRKASDYDISPLKTLYEDLKKLM